MITRTRHEAASVTGVVMRSDALDDREEPVVCGAIVVG
jgi:hypothetical protein